ncbi:MAG: hypothetical protein L0227_15430, partial [Chloroflexi bacterium]|nr:hypothetical protein [Chloroflexota bacterium]
DLGPILPSFVARTEAADPPAPESRTFRRRGMQVSVLDLILSREIRGLSPAGAVVGTSIAGLLFILFSLVFMAGSLASSGSLGERLPFVLFPFLFALIGLWLMRGVPAKWRLATGDADLLEVTPDAIRFRDLEPIPWDRVGSIRSHNGNLEVLPANAPANARPHSLPLDYLDADEDEVLDLVARYHVVDEA